MSGTDCASLHPDESWTVKTPGYHSENGEKPVPDIVWYVAFINIIKCGFYCRKTLSLNTRRATVSCFFINLISLSVMFFFTYSLFLCCCCRISVFFSNCCLYLFFIPCSVYYSREFSRDCVWIGWGVFRSEGAGSYSFWEFCRDSSSVCGGLQCHLAVRRKLQVKIFPVCKSGPVVEDVLRFFTLVKIAEPQCKTTLTSKSPAFKIIL